MLVHLKMTTITLPSLTLLFGSMVQIMAKYENNEEMRSWDTSAVQQATRNMTEEQVDSKLATSKSEIYSYTWSSWGEITACSFTCGTGVRFRKRYCYKSSEDLIHITSSSLCAGADRQYELCNTQECSQRWQNDIKSSQCLVFNKKTYRGQFFTWKSQENNLYSKKYGPCDIVCVTSELPKYRLLIQALDGTPCLSPTDDVRGLCIAKKCIPIGCDSRLFSSLKTDACGVCGGQNNTCRRVAGIVEGLVEPGFYRVIEIPALARNIVITDVTGSATVFAIRNSKILFFVEKNGMPGSKKKKHQVNIAGSKFYYRVHDPKRDLHKQLTALGPINETIHVLLYSPTGEKWLRITYDYILSKFGDNQDKANGVDSNVHFTQTKRNFVKEKLFSINSAEGGVHLMNNKYRYRLPQTAGSLGETWSRNKHVTETNLTEPNQLNFDGRHELPKIHNRAQLTSYSSGSIGFSWKLTKDAPCSATCMDGIQSLYAECYSSDNQVVDEIHCQQLAKPLPNVDRCKGLLCDARWVASSWSQCSTSCGKGMQYRSVRCWRQMGPGFDSTVSKALCASQPQPTESRECVVVNCGPVWEMSEWIECSAKCGAGEQKRNVRCSSGRDEDCNLRAKPSSSRPCNKGICESHWVVGNWSQCSGPCEVGARRRSVSCQDNSGHFQHDKYCNQTSRPLAIEACGDKNTCLPVWVPQEWGVCSVECGEGKTSRSVVCGQFINGEFLVRNEKLCIGQPRPAAEGHCREKACKALWYTTEWSPCSKSCGDDGTTTRRVECYQDGKSSLGCNVNTKPTSIGKCYLSPCEYNIDENCQDVSRTKHCTIVVEGQLCEHSFYAKSCCRSCAIARLRANATMLPWDSLIR